MMTRTSKSCGDTVFYSRVANGNAEVCGRGGEYDGNPKLKIGDGLVTPSPQEPYKYRIA